VTGPSRGLVPQLVDLLHALTASQELLTHRVRNAHLELLGLHPSGVDESWQTQPLDPVEPQLASTAGAISTPTYDLCEPFSADTDEARKAPSALAVAASDSDPSVKGNGVSVHHHVVPAPITWPERIASVKDDALEKERTQPKDFQTTRRDTTGLEPENRNYNFFDELDARLADLGDSEDESDEFAS
jgi:hypothetical protein